MATSVQDKNAERRKQVMLGDLPADFLRIGAVSEQQQQVSADEQAAMMLQQQMAGAFSPGNSVGRLALTIAQAKLNKNYGVTRMDPYCRVRIGHTVYETHTDHNGAKNPRWNKVIQCFLPVGVNSFYLEIFDECAFTVDERIAWGHYTIPDSVFNGETLDDWYPLSGRQGDEKEGMINLIMTLTPISAQPYVYQSPVVMVPAPMYYPTGPVYNHAPVYPATAAPAVQGPAYTEADLKQVHEMFPNMDLEVVRSIMDANRGNKDVTINSLLQMSADS